MVSIRAFREEGGEERGARSEEIALLQSVSSEGTAALLFPHSSPLTSWFQSTPSGGKATGLPRSRAQEQTRFNPRLPGGRRPGRLRGADILVVSIHAFRGEGDLQRPEILRATPVSIHAFRGEGDWSGTDFVTNATVSIHAFRGEGDVNHHCLPRSADCFNPRLPGGRRRTRRTSRSNGARFNPRLPGGRRRAQLRVLGRAKRVSIHAFRGEGDPNAAQHR